MLKYLGWCNLGCVLNFRQREGLAVRREFQKKDSCPLGNHRRYVHAVSRLWGANSCTSVRFINSVAIHASYPRWFTAREQLMVYKAFRPARLRQPDSEIVHWVRLGYVVDERFANDYK